MAAYGAYNVTPSDTANLPGVATGGLYVGGAGNLTVQLANGDAVTLTAVPAGTLVPLIANKVFATGTSATLIIAFLGS